ncbi:MAG: acyl-CoA thioesterase [Anaerolineae bacterium]|nr:acyl-CoA thioesterase [Anaerolineae bacterium]
MVESRLRVRYAETDAQGVVYYANYFVWFEVARINYLRACGQDYREWEARGLGINIVEATCRYLAPARFDDPLVVRAWVSHVGNSSFHFAYQVLHEERGELLAEGHTVQVFVDLKAGKAVPIPPPLREVLAQEEGDA